MEALIASTGQEILKQGLLGVVILALLWAYVTKERAHQKCMEARLSDRDVTTKQIIDQTMALREMADAQKEASATHRQMAEEHRRAIADVAVALARSKRG